MRALLLAAVIGTPAAAQVAYPPTAVSQVESATVTLDASGNATWTFAPPFPAPPDVTHIPQAMDTANPIICNYTARTATAVTIHCWRTALIGLLTNLYAGATAGAQVNLIARYRAP